MAKVILELTASLEEVDRYGEKGLRELWIDILERYGNEEYYDPDLMEEILKERGEEVA